MDSLEDRTLLTAIMPDEQARLLRGLQTAADWAADSLSRQGVFATRLPVVNKTVAEAINLDKILSERLVGPTSDYFQGDSTPTVEELASALGGTRVRDDPSAFVIRKPLVVSTTDVNVPIDLSTVAPDGLNISADASGTVTLTVGVDFGLAFGVDREASADSEAFFIGRDSGLQLDVDVDARELDFGITTGFLGAQVLGGKVRLKVELGVGLQDPTPTDLGVTPADLMGTAIEDLVEVTTGPEMNALDVDFPLHVELGGKTIVDDVHIIVQDQALFADPTPVFKFTDGQGGDGGDVRVLRNFSQLDARDLSSLFGQLGSLLTTISPALNVDDRFAKGPDSLFDPKDGFPFVSDALNRLVRFDELVLKKVAPLFFARLEGASGYSGGEPARSDVTLTSEIVISVSLDDATALEVKVDPGPSNLDALLMALNASIAAQFGGAVVAEKDGDRVKIRSTDPGKTLRLVYDADNEGMLQLGFVPEFEDLFPKVDSIQELVAELTGLGFPNVDPSYDPATDSLTLHLAFADGFERTVDLDFTRDIDLGFAVLSLAGSATALLKAEAGVDLVVGLDLSPIGEGFRIDRGTPLSSLNEGAGVLYTVGFTGVADAEPDGRLSADALFVLSIVSIDGTSSKTITVPKGSTEDNTRLDSLVADLNTALSGADLDDRIVARRDGLRLRLEAIDPTILSMRLTAAGTAISELGFGAEQTGEADLKITRRDGTSFEVVLDGARTFGDVLDRINAASAASGGGVTASINEDENGFKVTDTSPLAEGNALTIEAINGSLPSGKGLGITGRSADDEDASDVINGIALHGETILNRLYLQEGGKLSASVQVVSQDISISAAVRGLGLSIEGGAADFMVGTSLVLDDTRTTQGDPPGRLFLAELAAKDDEGHPLAVASLCLMASGSVDLPIKSEGLDRLLKQIKLPEDTRLRFEFQPDPLCTELRVVPDFGGDDFLSSILDAFQEFSADDVTSLLDHLVKFFQDDSLNLFNDPIPLLKRSINDILGFTDRLLEKVGRIPDEVRELPAFLREKLGEIGANIREFSEDAAEEIEVAFDDLREAILGLPDTIADVFNFQLPGKVQATLDAFRRRFDMLTERFPDLSDVFSDVRGILNSSPQRGK